MDTVIQSAELLAALCLLVAGIYFFRLAASERGNRPDVRRRPNW